MRVNGRTGANGRKEAESDIVNGRTVSGSERVNGTKEAERVRVNRRTEAGSEGGEWKKVDRK